MSPIGKKAISKPRGACQLGLLPLPVEHMGSGKEGDRVKKSCHFSCFSYYFFYEQIIFDSLKTTKKFRI
jgi:hypothetical protein